ncbi:MAG: M48 family metalloprotease [Thermoleophilia bacterium]
MRLAVVAAAALWCVAGWLLWRTEVPSLALPHVDAAELAGPALLGRIEDLRAETRSLWAGGQAAQLLALGLLAWQGRGLARALRPIGRGRVRTGTLVGLLCALALWAVGLPFGLAAHLAARDAGLTRQAVPAWLGDSALGLLVEAVLVGVCVAVVLVLAGRLGRRWWLAAGPALALVAVAFALLQPLVVQPLFNRFEPLSDRALATRIEQLGERLGVRVGGVEIADASRRTTAPNASVTGIGPGRRVVIDDTLIEGGGFAEREVLAVAAHELAHVARAHVWKAVAWFALLVVPGAFLVALVLRRAGRTGDPSGVPLGLLVALAIFLTTLPLQTAVSRRYEAEADWLALRATDDPAAVEGLIRGFVADGLSDPDPPGWSYALLGTHPRPVDRVALARAFAAREASRAAPAGP